MAFLDLVIKVNLHRLRNDARGVEASTVEAIGGRYQAATGRNKREALANLADKLNMRTASFKIHFSEVR